MTTLKPIQQLMDLLTPEPIGDHQFTANTPSNSQLQQVYGGQVVAQAMSAGRQTVDSSRKLHSLHSYFLRRGQHDKPIQYAVEIMRDGGSFSTRRVVALQDDTPIFNCAMSFKVPETGVEHHEPMPANVPHPDELEQDEFRIERFAADHPEAFIPPTVDLYGAMDFRTHGPLALMSEEPEKNRAPTHGFWFKTKSSVPTDPSMHQCILGWISDYRLLATCILPHDFAHDKKRVQVASLDHALWFHRDFRVDEWIYHHMDSPVASDARGLNFGRFYNQQGELIATSMQEGLIRLS